MFDVASKGSEAPALKGGVDGDGLAAGMSGGEIGGSLASEGGAVQRKPADVASSGFGGGGSEIPHRAEMEASFGQDFSGVRAHTDANAQRASKELGAHAYAVGSDIAFGSANPDKSLVAHELTHVAQARNGGGGGGPQMKADAGIDTSGEHEAEAVEDAVKSGKPARSALSGGVATGGGPALKAGNGIARSAHGGGGSPFTFGMSFSPEGMEKSYEYKLWESPGIEVPLAMVPGMNFKIKPSVKVVGGAGVNWKDKALEANFGVLGNVQLGFSYGNAALAEVYGVWETKAAGGFSYKRHGGGAQQAGAAPQPKKWELAGDVKLSGNIRLGVEIGGGLVDWGFDFAKVDIGTLTGLKWVNGKAQHHAGWEWGDTPKSVFASVKAAIEKAKRLKAQGEAAFRNSVKGMKNAGRQVFHAGNEAINWISSW